MSSGAVIRDRRTVAEAVAVAPRPAGFRSSLDHCRGRGVGMRVVGVLSSIWMAASLLVTLAAVIAVATAYEASYGRLPTAVAIYQSWWFDGLFLLLAVNILGAAAVRWPWSRKQSGFVLTHAGMLVLMAGFAVAGHDRLDGMLVVTEGETASRITLPSDYLGCNLDGQERAFSIQPLQAAAYPGLARFALAPIWPLPTAIDSAAQARWLGRIDDVDIALSGCVPFADQAMAWGPAASGPAALAYALSVTPPGGETMRLDGWLHSRRPHDRMLAQGLLRIVLDRCDQPGYAADFAVDPATLPATGRLLVYHDGQRWELPATVGSHAIGDDQLVVTTVLPSAQVRDGQLQAVPDGPFNPVLVYRLASDPAAEPRQAWAALPDCIEQSGREHLVVYQHPAASLLDEQGIGVVELLLAPEGVFLRETSKRRGFLGARALAALPQGGLSAPWQGAIFTGAPMQIDLQLAAAYAHAAPRPQPVAVLPERNADTRRYIAVRATLADGRRVEEWIPRGAQTFVALPDGRRLGLRYATEQRDLASDFGLALHLDRFEHRQDPGGRQSAVYASEVTVVDGDGQTSRRRIDMNQPLHAAGLSVYQSGYSRLPDGRYRSHFTVAQDPGRWAKYIGSLLMVVGICTLYAMRRRPVVRRTE